MRGRNFSTEEKMAMVIEGLKAERTIADICREHKVSQTQFYKWRDKFLEGGREALTTGYGNSKDGAYKAEIEKLQKIIGKQTIQIEILKKTEDLIQTK